MIRSVQSADRGVRLRKRGFASQAQTSIWEAQTDIAKSNGDPGKETEALRTSIETLKAEPLRQLAGVALNSFGIGSTGVLATIRVFG